MNKQRTVNFVIALLSSFAGSLITHYVTGANLLSFTDMCVISLITCYVCDKPFTIKD